MRRTASPIRCLGAVALGAGREAWAIGAAMAKYRTHFAAPQRPTPRPSWPTHPVLLVHGLGHNDGAWSALGARLGAAGFFELTPVNYGLNDEVPRIAARIATQVDTLCQSQSVQRVHLIGHSLGGVAIRYWHDVLGGDASADAVVTLGAPHRGTAWTNLPLLSRAARDLVNGSPVTTVLTRRKARHDRWTTIGGTFDLVVPSSRAHLPSAVNVDVAAGHAGLLTSRAAGGHICMALLSAEDQRASSASTAAL